MTDQLLPDVLYHYTTQEGLIGILENHSIWATQIHYLNDYKEFWHAFDVARKQLGLRNSRTIDLIEAEKLEAVDAALGQIRHAEIFVTSFSQDGDSLSQWRAYGGDGNGFAIGFSREKIQKLADAINWRLGHCIYDMNKKINSIASVIDSKMATDFRGSSVSSNPNNPNEIYVCTPNFEEFHAQLLTIAPFVKHGSFHDEKEWRLVSDTGSKRNKISHRPGRSMLIPYCEFLLGDKCIDCIEKIVIGPTADMDLSEKSLSSYMRNNFHQEIAIIKSLIPYRNR